MKAREKKAALKKKTMQDVPPVPAADLSEVLTAQATRPNVTPPTLTSADLDRLIAEHLTKNNPKVEPATLDHRRRVRPADLLRPGRRRPRPSRSRPSSATAPRTSGPKLIDALLGSPEYAQELGEVLAGRDHVPRDQRERGTGAVDHSRTGWPSSSRPTAVGRDRRRHDHGHRPQRRERRRRFLAAHEARPVEMAGEVSRIFMGVQIQCAQCHDHKTDSWKRRQFHEFAAFFAGVRPRQVVPAGMGQLPVIAVVAQGARRYAMPDKENPAKQIPVAPRFFLSSSKSKTRAGPARSTGGSTSAAALAASYVTGQDNPWFAKAYINRIWYALMGEAFYEPIDDIGPERTPKAAEVLEPLAEQWQKGGYDIRWLFRTILNTEAYQRRVRSTANAAGKTPFASNCPSRHAGRPGFRCPRAGAGRCRRTPAATSCCRPIAKAAPGKNARRKPKLSSSLGDPKRLQNPPQTKRARPRRLPSRSGSPLRPSRRRPVAACDPVARGCCSTGSSASIPRSPTKTSWGRFPRLCS